MKNLKILNILTCFSFCILLTFSCTPPNSGTTNVTVNLEGNEGKQQTHAGETKSAAKGKQKTNAGKTKSAAKGKQKTGQQTSGSRDNGNVESKSNKGSETSTKIGSKAVDKIKSGNTDPQTTALTTNPNKSGKAEKSKIGKIKNPKKNNKTAAYLKYGDVYTMQNGWNGNQGGFLTVNGQGCQDNHLCVNSTVANRKGNNGWKILSASGKKAGEAVAANDLIILVSTWNNNGGNLGVRGYGQYDPDNAGFVTVSTWKENPKDGATTWKVMANNADLQKGVGISLQNQWSGAKTYLDTRGYNCNGGDFCVSGSKEKNRDGKSGTWEFKSI